MPLTSSVLVGRSALPFSHARVPLLSTLKRGHVIRRRVVIFHLILITLEFFSRVWGLVMCTVKGVCARALRLYSNEDSAFRAGEHYDCTF